MAKDKRALSRRSFCWTLAGVLVAPGIAIAQTSNAFRRIGVLEPGTPERPEDVWKNDVQQHAEALVLGVDALVFDQRFRIVDAATRHGLPTMAQHPSLAREGGVLITYSATLSELYRLRAEYIDRILRGAKPSDLPVQQLTKFELVINLKTANALGITVPKELMLRAGTR